jgi:hypothetical protein
MYFLLVSMWDLLKSIQTYDRCDRLAVMTRGRDKNSVTKLGCGASAGAESTLGIGTSSTDCARARLESPLTCTKKC